MSKKVKYFECDVIFRAAGTKSAVSSAALISDRLFERFKFFSSCHLLHMLKKTTKKQINLFNVPLICISS